MLDDDRGGRFALNHTRQISQITVRQIRCTKLGKLKLKLHFETKPCNEQLLSQEILFQHSDHQLSSIITHYQEAQFYTERINQTQEY